MVRSTTREKTLNPEYNESLFLEISENEMYEKMIKLYIQVYDFDIIGKDDFEGQASIVINLSAVMDDKVPVLYNIQLEPDGGNVSFSVKVNNVTTNDLKKAKKSETTDKKKKNFLSSYRKSVDVSTKQLEWFLKNITKLKQDNVFQKLDMAERTKVVQQTLLLDTDGDGFISAKELFTYLHNNGVSL